MILQEKVEICGPLLALEKVPLSDRGSTCRRPLRQGRKTVRCKSAILNTALAKAKRQTISQEQTQRLGLISRQRVDDRRQFRQAEPSQGIRDGRLCEEFGVR